MFFSLEWESNYTCVSFPSLDIVALRVSQGLSAQQTAGVVVAGASFIQPALVKIAVEQLGLEETQEFWSQSSASPLLLHGWGAELARVHWCCSPGVHGDPGEGRTGRDLSLLFQ